MKKHKILLGMLLLFLIGVAGCSKKAISPDDMAALFVDKFIYDKDTSDFEENFVDGDILGKQLTMKTNTFEDTFSNVFDSITDNLTSEEKNKLATDLMTKVREESSYTYSIKNDKKKVDVTYKVKGFNYASLVKETLENVLGKLKTDTLITEEKIPSELIDSFEESLNDIKAVKSEKKVTLTFTKVKNKWQIGDNQDEKLDELLLLFVTGQKDKDTYEKVDRLH